MATTSRLAAVVGVAGLVLSGCAAEWDRPAADPRDEAGAGYDIVEPVWIEERTADVTWGLPRDGEPSIADLAALLPSGRISRDEPDLFVSADSVPPTDQCQGEAPDVLDELPMVIEGIVSLQPSRYLKVPICGQDERFYGSWVIEDDTGGMVVLRDSRIAFARPGDRVRLEVRGVGQFYGSPDQRMVVISDATVLERGAAPVLFTPTVEAFDSEMVGRTHRIEGHVAVAPTNANFNAMVLADRPLPPSADADSATPVCIETCAGTCRQRCPSDNNALCAQRICPAICADGVSYDASKLPGVCWNVAIEAELGRRGLTIAEGTHLAVTAPVVGGFGGLQMWVVRLGQLEFL